MPRLKKRKRSNPIPMFIEKLTKMLQDEQIQKIVSWNENGDKFVIKNMTEFVTAVLPKFYKHNNLASFIRQLNMHNFHKVKHEEISKQSNEQGYYHPNFLRDQPQLLASIKRKSQKPQEKDKDPQTDIRNQMEELKKRQNTLFKKYEEIMSKSNKLEQINQFLACQLKKQNQNASQIAVKRSKEKSSIKEQQYLIDQFMDYSKLKDLQNKNFDIDNFMDVDQQLNPKETLEMLRNRYEDS